MPYDIGFAKLVDVQHILALRDSLRTNTAMDIQITVGGGGVIIHSSIMPNATMQNLMRNIIDMWESLILSATKTTIAADDLDSTLISWAGQLGDAFDYVVTLEGETVASGTDSILPFQITFTTDVPGTYLVKVSKQNAYDVGYINIEAE